MVRSQPSLLLTSFVKQTLPNVLPVSIYDIKFYPYSQPGEDPIFAAVAEREVSLVHSFDNKHLSNQLYK